MFRSDILLKEIVEAIVHTPLDSVSPQTQR